MTRTFLISHSYTGGKTEEPNRLHACRASSDSKSLFFIYLSSSDSKTSGQRKDNTGSKGTINIGLQYTHLAEGEKKNQAKLRNSSFPTKRIAFVWFFFFFFLS